MKIPVSFVLVVVVIVALIISAVFLFSPLPLPLLPPNLTKDNLIGLAQLSIEVAGVSSLLLAAWEFHRTQRKPKLRLWMEHLRDKPAGKPTQKITMAHEHSSPGGGKIYDFPFQLLIENYGNAVGRWARISLEIYDPRPPVRADMGLRESDLDLRTSRQAFPNLGTWVPDSGTTGSRKRFTFHASDSFVVYSHPPNITDLRPWMDELGFFVLEVPVRNDEDLEKLTVQILCTVEADGFSRESQVLEFQFKQISN